MYSVLDDHLLATLRADAGAPVLAGTAYLPGSALGLDQVAASCEHLAAQLRAAGYEVATEINGTDLADLHTSGAEGTEPWSFTLGWGLSVPSPFTDTTPPTGFVQGTLSQSAAGGWQCELDVTIPEQDSSESLTLECTRLTRRTLTRWLTQWLDAGLSAHLFLSRTAEASAAAVLEAPAQPTQH